MLIAIDIGNTNITIGFLINHQVVHNFRITTKMNRTSDEYGYMIKSFLLETDFKISDIDDIIISSVVPKIMYSFTNAIRKYLKKEPIIVNDKIKTDVKILIDNPSSLGTDRLVDAIGAYSLCKKNCLVIDFGTATTFDIITKDKEFLGGATAPGIRIAGEALSGQTAQLPEIAISKPKNCIAKNTIDSMQAGLVIGYIGLVEKLITEIKKEFNKELYVISTGGLGKMIYQETNLIDSYNPDLIFIGLETIYNQIKKKH